MATDRLFEGINKLLSADFSAAPHLAAVAHRNIVLLLKASAPFVDLTNVALMLLNGGNGFDLSLMQSYTTPLRESIQKMKDCGWQEGTPYLWPWYPFDAAVYAMVNSSSGEAFFSSVIRGDADDVVFVLRRDGRIAVHDNSFESLKSGHNDTPHFTCAIAVGQSLCMAKNATWVEAEAPRSTRRRYPAVSGIRYRHIEIDMGKPKRKGEPHDAESHGVPWHHRRGHWAYYSPEKPLFGRAGAHGWYWRPYTEVGDKAHGEIVQDYTVRGNLPGVSA